MAQAPSGVARRKARHAIVQALYQWQISHNNLKDIERQFLVEQAHKNMDKDYFCEILHAIPAQVNHIDGIIQTVISRDLDDVSPVELAVMRMACYELEQRLDIPYKVVINEAVDAVKKYGAADAHKFINGALDKLAPQLRAIEVKAQRKAD